MICSWRWFIHPATAISTNRNGSRTLGIVSSLSSGSRPAVTNQRDSKQFQFSDHTRPRRWRRDLPYGFFCGIPVFCLHTEVSYPDANNRSAECNHSQRERNVRNKLAKV